MKPFDIIDAPQRSPEWFQSRLGRLTGSVAGKMLAKGRTKGEESKQRRNLRLQLVLERLTGAPMQDDYQTPAMQAGLEREPLAFAAYEALTGEMVQRSGFLAHREHMAGCSLDGHIGDFDVLLSIKCRQPAAHLAFLQSGTIPADALAQIRHELWLTGSAEHHYFSWNPDFPEALQARVVTVKRASVDVDGYAALALAFLDEVDAEYRAVFAMANNELALRESVA
jgi:predicted phage-related endonuclease